ncbi:MAG: nuclear transport factor 2 family protein [Vicinamibacterales bacterium]
MSTEIAHNTPDIETILKAYETALNGNDLETILGLYGDSPVFMPQHAPALVGRDAVRAGYAHVFNTIKLSVRFDVHEVQEAGEWAWARTSSAGRTRILSSGAETPEGNNELFVFRREKGAWKIHRYLFSTNQPPRA